jgi:hypothetical protein
LRTLASLFSSMRSYYAIMSFSPGEKVTLMVHFRCYNNNNQAF